MISSPTTPNVEATSWAQLRNAESPPAELVRITAPPLPAVGLDLAHRLGEVVG